MQFEDCKICHHSMVRCGEKGASLDGINLAPSCRFVKHWSNSDGKMEQAQCLFIDWCLLTGLLKIVDGALDFSCAFDIIPSKLEQEMELLHNDFSKLRLEQIVTRYLAYLSRLRDFLVDEELSKHQRPIKGRK